MDFSQIKKAGKTLWYRFRGECIFCNIVKSGDAEIVYENDDVMAFAPLKRGILSEGHILVIPKEHYENIFDIPKEELIKVIEAVKNISSQLEKDSGFNGVNLLNASGKSAQQSVSHFHFHLVPRSDEEDANIWPETGYTEENYEETYERLKNLINP